MKNNRYEKSVAAAFMVLMMACLFAACSEKGYTISGTIADATYEGKPVMLGKQADDRFVWLDTVEIANGAYEFEGLVEAPAYACIVIDYAGRMNALPMNLILENAKIAVATDAERKTNVSGTELNELLQTYFDSESLLKQQNDHQGLAALTLEFVKTNINNVAGQSQAHKVLGASLEELEGVVSGATEESLQTPAVAKITARIQGFKKTAIGQPFADFRMFTPEGKEVSLSDYAGKGKYVLVDFWASWCGPCRAEMPNLVAAYEKYKDKGFEIVGVSCDADKESWSRGLKDFGTPPWPQMSDLKAWDSPAVSLYTITGIPHMVLIDKDGIIIAKNLRGQALHDKLEQIL